MDDNDALISNDAATEPTLTSDQLESLRRSLYESQPGHNSPVNANDARQALLDTLTGAVVTTEETADPESGQNAIQERRGADLTEREPVSVDSVYPAQYEVGSPGVDQLQQYPEDVSLDQAQKLSSISHTLEHSNSDMDMDQLRAEVRRLKEHVRRLENTDGAMAAAAAQTLGQLAAMTFPGGITPEHPDLDLEHSHSTAGPSNPGKSQRAVAAPGGDSSEIHRNEIEPVPRQVRKRKAVDKTTRVKREIVPMNDSTGKRMVIKERTDQLAKEIRRKMRSLWGQGPDEQGPLPGPEQGGPDWPKGHRHPDNIAFQDHVATLVLQDIQLNLHPTSIPYAQQTFEACRSAAGTAFLNFAKRYSAQIDLGAKEKGARDNKRGRRWARKDLKQKKRSKAAARMEESISQSLLRMDYMSSECSSEGDDYDLVPGEWQRLANLARTDQSGQVLEAEKVLEVKTPQWRSAELQSLYDRIDVAAQQIVTEAKGRGHAAAPLHRFKLDPLRQKRPPSDVEPWMLVDGQMPDELTLPVPKRVKIGRPKGRKNKVNELGTPGNDLPEHNGGTRPKKRKRTTRHGEGNYQPLLEDLNDTMTLKVLKRHQPTLASGHSADVMDTNDDAGRTLNIVALPSTEDTLIDPEIEIAGPSGASPDANRVHSLHGSPGLHLVDLNMIDASASHNAASGSEATYPAEWADQATGGSGDMQEQGLESRSDTRSDLQDYLMRFSNVVD